MLCIIPSLRAAGFIAEGANAFAVIVIGFVGLNFVFELALNIIVAPALYRVIKIVDRSLFAKVKEKPDTATEQNLDIENKDAE